MKSGIKAPGFRVVAALLLVLAAGCVANAHGAFFQWGTHRDVLRQISVTGILACGMTFVIIAGGIDLSVGSVLGLSSVVFAELALHRGQPALVAVPAALAIGALAGLTSGTLIARYKVQPFVATLALMVLARGLAKWLSGGQKISQAIQQPDGNFSYVDLPRVFAALDSRIFGGNLAGVTLVLVACLVLSWVVLARLSFGRYVYAIGGNEEAARFSGVRVMRVKLIAYGLCGICSAIAGICQAAQEQQGDPEAGVGYELTAIASAVIGGNSLAGGRGGIGFTTLGILVMGYLEKILSINAVSEANRLMLTGAIIVVAVLFQRSRSP